MSDAKFTPGPWAFQLVPESNERVLPKSDWSGVYFGRFDEENGGVAGTFIEGTITDDRDGMAEANCRLMALAPDLYEALTTILDAIGALSNPNELHALVGDKSHWILATLADARGE
jgi:hypothetical protein